MTPIGAILCIVSMLCMMGLIFLIACLVVS